MEPGNSGQRVCTNCGTTLSEGSRFCPNCGTPFAVPTPDESPTQHGFTDEVAAAIPTTPAESGPPTSSWDSPRFDTQVDSPASPASWDTPARADWTTPEPEAPTAAGWQQEGSTIPPPPEPVGSFGVPPQQPQYPGSAPPPPSAEQLAWESSGTAVPPEGNKKTLWIILAIVAFIILVCCCILPLSLSFFSVGDIGLQQELRDAGNFAGPFRA